MVKKLGVLAIVLLFVSAPRARAQVQVRVATFNIENFDPGDATQFNAAVAILNRIGADVVCVQEIDTVTDFNTLASAAGYAFKQLADGGNSFDGAHHAGIMSVYAFNFVTTETSITLSGDAGARDLTRNFIVAEIAVPGAADDLVYIGNHWKSGSQDADEFRRSVESIRAMQITASYDSNVMPYFVVGDMNDDLLDGPDSPSQFDSLPGGLPGGFSLGSDITFPIANGVFKALEAGSGAQDLTVISARQKDNSDATRRASGRRLDYLWRSTAVTVVGSEVYDSQDEGLGGGLPKVGAPLPFGTSDDASDHLLVFADVEVPDNQSGACCTACGCDDTVNEAQCLALGGGFMGAGEPCEVDTCPSPPNDMRINEVLVAHDGTQDMEFVEILGQPHELLCGLTILVVEGEGFSKGRVDLAVSLDDCGGGPCALDQDGYFIAGGSGLPPDLQIGGGIGILEDGTQTVALVRDCTVGPNDDIDADNDGVAEVAVGDVIDAIGFIDGDYPVSDAVYFSAPAFGPDGTTVPPGAARCPNGVDTDTLSDWVRLSRPTDGSDGCVPITPDAANPANCGGDSDGDGDFDLDDYAAFQSCIGLATVECSALELDGQCGIDLGDYAIFEPLMTGP